MDQAKGLVDVGPVRCLFDISVVGNLIHIISNGGQLPKQGGIGIGGPGAELYAHHQLTQHRLHFQARGVGQLFQVGVLGGVQPQGNGFVGFDGSSLLSANRTAFRPAMRNASRLSLAGFTRLPIFGVISLDALIDSLFKRGRV